MTQRLVPARLALSADGTPYSPEYGDVYHSAQGGLEQARHVFLGGNGLPERWRGRRTFTILETGFGLGTNFLATLQAWRDDAQRCERLHFVSIEKHPFPTSDLFQALKTLPEIKPQPLLDSWPMLVPGMHRAEFEEGRVVLTMFFADIAAIRELDLKADAFYLDGFAPDRNPEMWSPQLMRALSRLAAPGATAATWSVAASVRRALEQTGFDVEKKKGFGTKREMLSARIRRTLPDKPRNQDRSAIVVGAGIAGAAASERLAARGWEVTLLERRGAPAEAGRHAGVFHPLVTRDDSVFARLTRAAFLNALNRWSALEGLEWARCGVLQLARDDDEDAAQRAAIEILGLPAEFAQYVERTAACERAGLPVAAGGLWFPSGGWVQPLSLVRAQLAQAGGRLQARFGCEVARLARDERGWTALGAAGMPLARASVCVLANAAEALELAPERSIRLRRTRGQISFLPADAFVAPRTVLLRGGFLLPGRSGESIAGASYDLDDFDPQPRADSHEGNLERVARIVPGAGLGLDPARLDGMVGFRSAAPDRLPLIGAMPGQPGLYGAFAYGSRGLLWAGLGAELLASMIEGEPLPVERKLVGALAPERFLLRAKRRNPTAARG